MMGRKPIGGIFSVGLEEPYRWKDSVQSEPEIRLWVADGIANGLRPWFTKFSGVLHDHALAAGVERIYDWHYRHERYLRNERAAGARRAAATREQTATFHRRRRARRSRRGSRARHVPRARRGAHAVRDGARRAARRPSASIAFKLLILAERRRALGRAVRGDPRFVERGGSLVATFETSLYDEWGAPARRLRPRRPLRRVVRRTRSTGRCRTPI